MKNWTIKKYQDLGKEKIMNLSNEDFYSLALKQKEFYPDMLKICDEDKILRIFYKQYERKYVEGQQGARL